MEKKQKLKSFEKYITKLILPKFSEISSFEVTDGVGPLIEFTFYMNEDEGTKDKEIEEMVHDMMRMLSIENIVYGINLRSVPQK